MHPFQQEPDTVSSINEKTLALSENDPGKTNYIETQKIEQF